jgi:very-short-patch-repair endonuclease
MNVNVKTPYYVVQLARDLRNNLTECERLLWDRLKNRKIAGYKFRCQHPIFRYVLDFYCLEKLLAIELDGDVHKKRKDYDSYRDDFMKSMGIHTLRFTNNQIMQNTDMVVCTIESELLRDI